MFHLKYIADLWKYDPIMALIFVKVTAWPIIEFFLYRFMKTNNPSANKFIKWSFRLYIGSTIMVLGSEAAAFQFGDTFKFANAGRYSAAIAAASMIFYCAVKIATDHKVRARANRDAKQWGFRLLILIPLGALAIPVLMTISSDDPVFIRGQEALFLCLGPTIPMLFGRGFVLMAMQLNPWLPRYL